MAGRTAISYYTPPIKATPIYSRLRPSAVTWCLFEHKERIGNSFGGEGRSKKTKADLKEENT